MCDTKIKGRIHSFQSLGAVDGPGIRFVIFMQGCPYSCPYCHNPDTQAFGTGDEYGVSELTEKIKRYKPYFGKRGGVTASGGEPLCQTKFLTELFKSLHGEGITTALDTAGMRPNDRIRELLRETDTVLCDIKFPDNERYKKHLGITLDDTLSFLSLCNEQNKEIIIRHVVVPGMTDTEESVLEIKRLAYSVCTPSKIELLPFRKLCIEKYDKLGIPFPLADTDECSEECIRRLSSLL